MTIRLIVDIEWMEFFYVVDMVVENVMVDMTVEDYRKASFHKWVLTNPFDGVGFGPFEETMPSKA